MIFQQELTSLQKSEANLILALNKLLEKTGILAYILFSKIRYLQFIAIFILLTEKSSAENLVKNHFHILIRGIIKFVDEKIIDIKALKY